MLPVRTLAASLLFCFCAAAVAQTPLARIRGSIEKYDGNMLTIKQRDGSMVAVKVGEKVGVSGVVAAPLSEVKTGKFIGTATLGRKDGEQKVLVPEGTPIVTFVDADASALKPGAHVFISRAVREPDGGISAARVAVGLNGVVPPM